MKTNQLVSKKNPSGWIVAAWTRLVAAISTVKLNRILHDPNVKLVFPLGFSPDSIFCFFDKRIKTFEREEIFVLQNKNVKQGWIGVEIESKGEQEKVLERWKTPCWYICGAQRKTCPAMHFAWTTRFRLPPSPRTDTANDCTIPVFWALPRLNFETRQNLNHKTGREREKISC